ncbi:MAG: M1 family metallopeptidase [Porticoccaceae bacterium]|nr:M1 family metallopeptidase [Porticoccaceae bacterium]
MSKMFGKSAENYNERGLTILSACLLFSCLFFMTINCSNAMANEKDKRPKAILFEQDLRNDVGGVLPLEQAAYDARHYDLDINVDPERRFISGTVVVKARVLKPLKQFVLDLDSTFKVSKVELLEKKGFRKPLRFEHRPSTRTVAGAENRSESFNSRLWIDMSRQYRPGELLEIAVSYAGKPYVSANPPWGGGFIWDKAEDGSHWIGVTCQSSGADVWWPVKEHTSDEPEEGVTLRFTVPADLEVVSNGRFQSRVENEDGTATHHWQVTAPINTYSVTFNAGPFRKISKQYQSVSGKRFPVSYWVLPEHYQDGKALYTQLVDDLAFLEKLLGPYPFQGDKMAFVDTPYVGMEHQTIVAFNIDYWSGDANNKTWFGLPFHELTHEWWGNLMTVAEARDMWLQESFAGYMTYLYYEYYLGKKDYHQRMLTLMRRPLVNNKIVAPLEPITMKAFKLENSPYSLTKGVPVLHSLRFLLGDEVFFELLRRQAYPNPNHTLADINACKQCRVTKSEEFITLAEKISGRDLGWFFELYLRRPELPKLLVEDKGESLAIQWQVPDGLDFPMPVEVEINGERQRIAMPDGMVEISKQVGDIVLVDPDFWVFRQAGPKSDQFGSLLNWGR